MPRTPFFAAGLLALGAAAHAQTAQDPSLDTPVRIPSPVKYGGVVHVQTGTVSRGATAVAHYGSTDTIYACTAETPYFTAVIGPSGAVAGGVLTDSGGVPRTDNTYVTGVARDENLVSAFAFAYCDLGTTAGSSAWNISFYESLAPCTSVAGLVPTAAYLLMGLNANGCWLYDIDLSGVEFCLGADGGDGAFDDDPDFDSFGWSLEYAGTGSGAAGPIAACDPSATDTNYVNPNAPNPGGNPPAPAATEGSATYYNPLSNCTSGFTIGGPRETGSGFFSQDFYFVDDPVAGSPVTGCYFAGGYFNVQGACGAAGGGGNNPFSSFYMELESNAVCEGPHCICSSTLCPATVNSSGAVGVCEAFGSPTVAANEILLRASSLPTGVFGVFLHAQIDTSSNPVSAGQGVLCLGAAGRFSLPAQIKQANAQGECELSTSLGEWSVTSMPVAGAPFTIAATAGQTSYFGFWHRDFVAAPAFNFTGTLGVTWQ